MKKKIIFCLLIALSISLFSQEPVFAQDTLNDNLHLLMRQLELQLALLQNQIQVFLAAQALLSQPATPAQPSPSTGTPATPLTPTGSPDQGLTSGFDCSGEVACGEIYCSCVNLGGVRTVYTLTRSLQRGSSGDDVSRLQAFLKQSPEVYPEGLVTGYFGSLTEAAVQRFQEQYGIEALGVVGPITISKINELAATMAIPVTPNPLGF